ncbi:hypothetical protein GWK47_004033 [Chionoecetes opilio]|uniref:Uncharacterized protein n=1 Tax=Chionoecetes opilio TaxID=41210 RepID=A0A8J4YQT6_CHIOP|nr:hypothetical protein GWK47_004033 [Chionoecetes opilio]
MPCPLTLPSTASASEDTGGRHEPLITGVTITILPAPPRARANHHSPREGGLTLYEVTCKWIKGAGENTLSSVSCSLKAGDLLAVIGPVGAGKVRRFQGCQGDDCMHNVFISL